ncbi:MAG: enoyl-CoA hydratase-related protein [Haliea sp.]|uniref:enoyl-CoA hydratase-related protein n=1 Tax=Marinobacter salarius TaxID=1420917 RepID=UPI0032EC0349
MTVHYSVENHVARVTIDRPDRMNAVDAATWDRLEQIWVEIEQDPDVRVVVLTGSGSKAFSAGADMKSAGEKKGLEYWADPRPGGFGGIAMRKTLNVPVIARVNGFALGGGFEMVLGCDIVISAEHTKFGFTEPRVGRLPLNGGMVLLPRLIPEKIAMGILLTGSKIMASEAERYGLINEVVPESELDQTVDKWVENILACAPLSLKAIKESVKQTIDLPVELAQSVRLPALLEALTSEDAKEGVQAFKEKRAPDWKGR